MDHFFTRNSMGRVFGFLEVSSVRKNWKIYPNFKIPEIFGFLDLGLSLEPDTWLYLFGHGISQTQPMWGHTQNFSSFGPLILHLPGGGWISPPLTQMCSWDPLTIRVKRVKMPVVTCCKEKAQLTHSNKERFILLCRLLPLVLHVTSWAETITWI